MRVKSIQELPEAMRAQAEAQIAGARSIAAPAQSAEVRRSKYGSTKTEVNGITFDSKWEGQRYRELLLRERMNLIHDLQVHVAFGLHVYSPEHKPVRIASLVVDFVYWTDDDQMRCEDTKSAPTRKKESYRLKRKMFEAEYGVEIIEVVKVPKCRPTNR